MLKFGLTVFFWSNWYIILYFYEKDFWGHNTGPFPLTGRICPGPQFGLHIRTRATILEILIYYMTIFGKIEILLKF